MSIGTVKNQLLHDLKTSWKKTALLGVLLAVGMFFWLPQLVRAVAGNGHAKKPAVPVATTTPETAVPKTTTISADASAEPAAFTWESGNSALDSDPLVRSVEVAAIHGDPFRLDRDQFPPPVLFESEPKESKRPSAEPPKTFVADGKLSEKLVLKSTIVGVKRRAAFINNKLYLEGRKIEVDGQSFVLSAVHPRRVVVTQGGKAFELALPSTFETEASDNSSESNSSDSNSEATP